MIEIGQIAVNTRCFKIHLHVGGRGNFIKLFFVERNAEQFVADGNVLPVTRQAPAKLFPRRYRPLSASRSTPSVGGRL